MIQVFKVIARPRGARKPEVELPRSEYILNRLFCEGVAAPFLFFFCTNTVQGKSIKKATQKKKKPEVTFITTSADGDVQLNLCAETARRKGTVERLQRRLTQTIPQTFVLSEKRKQNENEKRKIIITAHGETGPSA